MLGARLASALLQLALQDPNLTTEGRNLLHPSRNIAPHHPLHRYMHQCGLLGLGRIQISGNIYMDKERATPSYPFTQVCIECGQHI